MSDTPRTNMQVNASIACGEGLSGAVLSMTTLARTLERELAAEHLDKMTAIELANDYGKKLSAMTAERDKLREALVQRGPERHYGPK